ncbi:hypothetical protein BDZ91DRAFT_759801 [Kalaharituber pfeilii]|nr:hypothetical protein BDZ91DRAFT_759801 [Kalaharituber pfeilii]
MRNCNVRTSNPIRHIAVAAKDSRMAHPNQNIQLYKQQSQPSSPRPRHRVHSSTSKIPVIIPPLPRFTLAYLLQSSPRIRALILGQIRASRRALHSFRLVNKAFAKYAEPFLFKEIRINFGPDYWKHMDMTALARIGHEVTRITFQFKHEQLQHSGDESMALGTRLPYKLGREYELELLNQAGRDVGEKLVWATGEHLNPVPEIIEFRTTGGGDRPREEPQQSSTTTGPKPRARTIIPIEKTGGLLDTSQYGPLYQAAASVVEFKEVFLRTPNIKSLVLQCPGNDLYWEYSTVDVAIVSIRLGAAAAAVKLEQLYLLPVHILGMESLSPIGSRHDIVPEAFSFLGWGGLQRLEVALSIRVLIAGGERGGRTRATYGRIVRGFLLALGNIGRNGLRLLKFQWIGGDELSADQVLECPFMLDPPGNAPAIASAGDNQHHTAIVDDGEENEDMAICSLLTFPNLHRLYIRNAAASSTGLTDFLEQKAPNCNLASLRGVALTDDADPEYVMSKWLAVWHTGGRSASRGRRSMMSVTGGLFQSDRACGTVESGNIEGRFAHIRNESIKWLIDRWG